ncbi:MAG: universal stress protein [Candidatus Gastranaerophilales bacterium]|nr:universal stress protein [Candidatus Gastranaerophilales bacterium]
MKSEKMILLPLDGSEASLSALLPAKSMAILFNIPIYILYVSDKELKREELIDKLKLDTGDLPRFLLVQKTGNPADVIISESQCAKYIVMGTHGETANLNELTGAVSKEVLKRSKIPVLLIRPDMKLPFQDNIWKPKKVLIPLNGTLGASHTLGPVVEILTLTSAEVDLLHIVTSKAEIPTEPGCLTTPYYVDFPQLEWTSWSKEFIRRFGPILHNHNHIKFNLSLLCGDPADEIILFADKNHNDLIAMTWHGNLVEPHASILKKVMLQSHCPCLLVRIV